LNIEAMTKSHSELMKELIPLYQEDPQRFMRFYNAVYLLLDKLPEGSILRISDHVRPTSYHLFATIASLLVIEENCRKGVFDDYLEFSDDYSEIRRTRKYPPYHPFRMNVKRI